MIIQCGGGVIITLLTALYLLTSIAVMAIARVSNRKIVFSREGIHLRRMSRWLGVDWTIIPYNEIKTVKVCHTHSTNTLDRTFRNKLIVETGHRDYAFGHGMKPEALRRLRDIIFCAIAGKMTSNKLVETKRGG